MTQQISFMGETSLSLKVKKSIDRIKFACPSEGYHLATSKGKDSLVIEALTEIAGAKHEKHYSLTTVDPPEIVQMAKADKKTIIDIPRYEDGKQITMWNLIPKKKMPPTRIVRYCCEILKESNGVGRITMTGVRWAESSGRKLNQGEITITDKNFIKKIQGNEKANFQSTHRGGVILNLDNHENRRMIELCYRTHKTLINPIIDWTDDDVWEFIRAERIKYCGLYDEGFTRLGCIGCPMATVKDRENSFSRWPTFKSSYIKTFEKMLAPYPQKGNWTTGEDVFKWWVYGGRKPKVLQNQISLIEMEVNHD